MTARVSPHSGPGRRRRTRTARDQRHQRSGHRRPHGGGLGPPGHRHGPRPPGPCALHPGDAPRPVRARLARPRPVRALQRARLHPAVLDALPHRLRADPRRPAGVPQLGQPHPGSPRAQPHPGRRGHHRAVGPRGGQRRRDGYRRALDAQPLLPRICDHHTYVIAGDGCFEEGISHEAASLAGHLQLGRLVYIYDDNHISIDGPTELAYNDNVAERFAAYGWGVDDIGEVANDLDALEAALLRAMADEDRPSLIILRSHIGFPSPHLTDTAKAHGDPLPDDEARLTRSCSACPPIRPSGCRRRARPLPPVHPRGQAWRAEWNQRFEAWDGRQATVVCRPGKPRPHRVGVRYSRPSPPRTGPWPASAGPSRPALDATAGAKIPGILPGSADLSGNTGDAPEGCPDPVRRRAPGG